MKRSAKPVTHTPEQIARRFMRARAGTAEPLMESLAAPGEAEHP